METPWDEYKKLKSLSKIISKIQVMFYTKMKQKSMNIL